MVLKLGRGAGFEGEAVQHHVTLFFALQVSWSLYYFNSSVSHVSKLGRGVG